jgi:hypothetical protein
MDGPFTITVSYKGKEQDFDVTLKVLGFTHRFYLVIDGTELFFERDDEGAFRAIVPPEQQKKQIDSVLLRLIADAIEAALA